MTRRKEGTRADAMTKGQIVMALQCRWDVKTRNIISAYQLAAGGKADNPEHPSIVADMCISALLHAASTEYSEANNPPLECAWDLASTANALKVILLAAGIGEE
jgi:hypothetical protein